MKDYTVRGVIMNDLELSALLDKPPIESYYVVVIGEPNASSAYGKKFASVDKARQYRNEFCPTGSIRRCEWRRIKGASVAYLPLVEEK